MSNSAQRGPTGNGNGGNRDAWGATSAQFSGGSLSAVGTNRSRKSLNPFQVIGLLMVFVLLAIVGGILTAAIVVPVAAGASTVTKTATDTFYEIPTDLDIDTPSQASKIYASDGKTVLATYYSENRTVVPLSKISLNMQNAVIATEDKRFWSHGGVDVQGITRAAVSQLNGNGGGGSTLTQQYVKNVLIQKASRAGDIEGVEAARATSMERKLKEAKLAMNVEKTKTKEQILEGYLNIAQFGTKVYGVEAAAQYYFSKSAANLSVVEAATIAGITQRPSTFDPIANPADSERRRNTVLTLMLQQDYITQDEYNEAIATKLEDTLKVKKTAVSNGCESAGINGFFCDYVTKTIMKDPAFGETQAERMDLLYRGGLKIITTLDLDKQKQAYNILQENVPAKNEKMIGAAMSSVEPGTGKILVMTQNRKYTPSSTKQKGYTSVNYNAGPDKGGSNGFQVGSTFKAFVLAEWFKEGHTLLESVDANKRTWQTKDFLASCANVAMKPWTPANSDGQGSGHRTVQQATALSINTAFVSIESKLDLCRVADTASEIGFRPTTHPDQVTAKNTDGITPDARGFYPVFPTASMVLGTQNSTPLYMAAAYATFASGGTYCEPVAITKVTDVNGKDIKVPQANCKQTLDSATAKAVTYALSKVISPGGGAPAAALADGRPGAGKTGTTNDNLAAWFTGFTPDLATSIWMGYPDSNQVPMQNITINGRWFRNVYGSSMAAPMWKQFMDYALKDQPKTPFDPIAKEQLGFQERPKRDPSKESDNEKSGDNKSGDNKSGDGKATDGKSGGSGSGNTNNGGKSPGGGSGNNGGSRGGNGGGTAPSGPGSGSGKNG